jgi:hypothetical protein
VQEAVFSSSSTGFRIRATQGQAADHSLAKPGLAERGLAEQRFGGFAKRAAATLFFTFFPADCRICGFPFIEVSRLPVCESCLLTPRPLQGSYCISDGISLSESLPDNQTGDRSGERNEDRVGIAARG